MISTDKQVMPLPHNAKGKYYVTSDCDGCGECYPIAIRNIDGTEDGRLYFVFKQPETPQEDEFLREAMEQCPLHCMRDDGSYIDW